MQLSHFWGFTPITFSIQDISLKKHHQKCARAQNESISSQNESIGRVAEGDGGCITVPIRFGVIDLLSHGHTPGSMSAHWPSGVCKPVPGRFLLHLGVAYLPPAGQMVRMVRGHKPSQLWQR
jgi:hypothetical protein